MNWEAFLAWAAMVIHASSDPIVTLLTEIGKQHAVEGRNGISTGNLLFVGSLFSIAPMTALFWRDWNRPNLRALTGRHWTMLTISAFLSSALTPGLFSTHGSIGPSPVSYWSSVLSRLVSCSRPCCS